MKIDPMFVLFVKEEIADGQTVTIVVSSAREIEKWETRFTDEELDSIRFEVPLRAPASPSEHGGACAACGEPMQAHPMTTTDGDREWVVCAGSAPGRSER